ncbi:hypothetical protein K9M59_03965 [Candidatus Gracilibacteria bacterium]|nr:hypothetical protein [Candidatus Gracilibacteria bacterium]MCF7819479.1 hypothetical protein [Candidatus Gracilibacteria bacterium]
MAWFSPELTEIKTYCEDCFRSEAFDATKYGRDFDFSRPFFEQFRELYYAVPHHISNAIKNENCEYIISAHQNKNCYMADEVDDSWDCYFGYTFQRVKNITEGLYIHDSEIGYQLVKAENCYAVFYSKNVFHCSESAFLLNCRSCKKCLFCANLRNKEYHIFNQKVSKEEFQKYWDFLFSGSQKNRETCREKFSEFLQTQYFPAATIIHCEDSTGDYITHSKNAQYCFCVDYLRDCKYCTDIHRSQDCMDVNIYEGELCYECNHIGPEGYKNRFSQLTWFSSDIDYSIDLYNCQNCFGSTSLKKEKYCILNKKYSREEYEQLTSKIIEHMKQTGEWGEFFPIEMSPQPYNHTMAQRFYPLIKKEVLSRGWKWLDEKEEIKESAEHHIPENLSEIGNDFTSKVFLCEETGKKFRFIPQEIKFYQKWGIPLPTVAPVQRIENLWNQLGERKLYNRKCAISGEEIETTYPPEFEGKVVSQEEYLKIVEGIL